MNYYVRSAGDSQLIGPCSLDDIRRQLSTGGMRPDFEAHPAEGQSEAALKSSTAWFSLSSLCPPGTLPAAQPAALPRSSASGGHEIQKAGFSHGLALISRMALVASPIAGLAVGYRLNAYFGWATFLGGLVSGLILLGFARVIDRLFTRDAPKIVLLLLLGSSLFFASVFAVMGAGLYGSPLFGFPAEKVILRVAIITVAPAALLSGMLASSGSPRRLGLMLILGALVSAGLGLADEFRHVWEWVFLGTVWGPMALAGLWFCSSEEVQ